MVSSDFFHENDALIIVDVQEDFCPGGALAVGEGDRVVPLVNELIKAAGQRGIPVFASRDWHPLDHVSFESQGGKWPPHCIQDTPGAAFHSDLELPASTVVVTKGVRFDHDQNSVFDETGLDVYLKNKGVQRVILAGLALDVCVMATAMDARNAGLHVVLIAEATRPVDPDTGKEAVMKMREAGVEVFEKSENERPHAEDVEVCLKAPEWAEHERFTDVDMACDDGRAGQG